MNLQTGDILHCSSGRLAPRIIRFLTKSKYNHTAMAIEVWGEMCIIDSQKNGVNIKTFEQWEKKYKYTYIVHRNTLLNDLDKRALSKRAMTKSGVTPYDWTGLILKQPWKLLTGKWKRRPKEDKTMYCSEFVAWVYKMKRNYQMNPSDVFNYCESNPLFDLVE